MGPKKGKGGKKGKAEEEKPEPTEYDSMDLEMLREVVPMLRQQLEKSMLDRNYVQLERVSGRMPVVVGYLLCSSDNQTFCGRTPSKSTMT